MTDKAVSPLRRRMIEDMAIRNLAPKTQHDYVQRVKDFAVFLGRSPATASKEENTIRQVMSPLDRLTPLMAGAEETRHAPPA